MDEKIKIFVKNLTLGSGVSIDLINLVEKQLGANFMDDYKAFISEANGAEGFVGPSYLILFPIEKLEEVNTSNEGAPSLIKFGSDGGGNVYVFDSRGLNLIIGEVSAIGMGLEEVEFRGYTFFDFLISLYESKYDNEL